MNIIATSKEILNTPFATVHPVELIKDEIKFRGITQKELALRMGMQPSNLNRFFKEKGTITPDIAEKLEGALDIPREIWLNMQTQYEIDKRNIEIRNELEKEAVELETTLSQGLNLVELYKKLSINPALYVQEKLERLEEAIGVELCSSGDLPFIRQHCFKKSDVRKNDKKNENTWLLLAYIEARKNMVSKEYVHGDAPKAAALIAEKTHSYDISEAVIKEILGEYGIVYCVVPKLDKTPIDAASMIVEGHPAIITTHRYNDMGRLIFNVLHELGHIHNHIEKDGGDKVFVSSDNSYSRNNKEEKEANEFAEDILIPRNVWKRMMRTKSDGISTRFIMPVLKSLSEEHSLNHDIVMWRYKYEESVYNLRGAKPSPIK